MNTCGIILTLSVMGMARPFPVPTPVPQNEQPAPFAVSRAEVDGPQRFAVEVLRLPVALQDRLAEIGDGMSAMQGVGYSNWGKVQPRAPRPNDPGYETIDSSSWWIQSMESIARNNRDLYITLDLYSPWGLETHPTMTIHDSGTGKRIPAPVGIKPEHVADYKAFIAYYLSQHPRLTHLQITEEPENKWVSGPRFAELVRFTKEAVDAFNRAHPERRVKLLVAGFTMHNVINFPEPVAIEMRRQYPSMLTNYPNVEQEVMAILRSIRQHAPHVLEAHFGTRQLDREQLTGERRKQIGGIIVHMARKLSIFESVIQRGDFDILTLHHDQGKTYDTIEEVMAWCNRHMDKHGTRRPIWIDDMHSGYYASPGRLVGGTNLSAEDTAWYRNLERNQRAAIQQYAESQPIWLVRKAVGNFAAGVERISIAYAHDMPDYHAAIWRYVGLFSQDRKPKPAYYTTILLVAKLDRFRTAERMGDHIYRFTFEGKPDVFVAWNEDGKRTVDFSRQARGRNIHIEHIVTEVTRDGQPVQPPSQVVPSSAVPLGPEPVFLELAPNE